MFEEILELAHSGDLQLALRRAISYEKRENDARSALLLAWILARTNRQEQALLWCKITRQRTVGLQREYCEAITLMTITWSRMGYQTAALRLVPLVLRMPGESRDIFRRWTAVGEVLWRAGLLEEAEEVLGQEGDPASKIDFLERERVSALVLMQKLLLQYEIHLGPDHPNSLRLKKELREMGARFGGSGDN